MPNDDDSVSIWYRRGRYAIGREGYRPFVSLPEEKAQRALSGTTTAERLSFGILLISGLVIGAQALGAPIPITVDAVLFILEFSMVVLVSSIIAKTVIDRKERSDGPSDLEVQGTFPDVSHQQGISIEAKVRDSQGSISVENHRPNAVEVQIKDAWSDSGSLELGGLDAGEGFSVVQPRSARSPDILEYVFETIGVADQDTEYEDTLHVVLGLSDRLESIETPEREVNLSIPLRVRAGGQVESEEVVQVSFERLTE